MATRVSIEAADGAERTTFPPSELHGELSAAFSQIMTAAYFCANKEVNAVKMRKMLADFNSEADAAQEAICVDLHEGEYLTWEHARKITLALTSILHAKVKEMLEHG